MGNNDYENISKVIADFKIPEVQIPKFEMPDYTRQIHITNNEALRLSEEMDRVNREKHKREIENNESLKSIVQYNEEISSYNKELVSLNEKILSKINSLDDTLLFLNKAFIDKNEMDKEKAIEHNALLLELITIIDQKDDSRLKEFLTNVGVPVGVGLLVEYFKIKLGLI